tara:strand:+ start:281 stop:511 length:231 start_codon:yes stop_codon:yes gene_type:complete
MAYKQPSAGPFKMMGSSPAKQDDKAKAAKAAYEKAKKNGTIKSNPAWRNLAFKAGFTNALVKKGGEFVSKPFSKAK